VWLDKAYLGHYALYGRVFVLAVVSSQLLVPNGAVSGAGHVRSLMQSLKFSLRKTVYVGCTRFSETTNNKRLPNFSQRAQGSRLQGMPYHCSRPSSASRSADAAEASSSVAVSVAASASASVACAVVGASPFSEM
jgi:hypothetical protein